MVKAYSGPQTERVAKAIVVKITYWFPVQVRNPLQIKEFCIYLHPKI